ncbi:MAG TPA: hypothetical protein VJC09_03300 [Candidatus Saccharimonadales bacterium]|nr:hypothetical protein [Candidatus Saccharimonadales bacterium]
MTFGEFVDVPREALAETIRFGLEKDLRARQGGLDSSVIDDGFILTEEARLVLARTYFEIQDTVDKPRDDGLKILHHLGYKELPVSADRF